MAKCPKCNEEIDHFVFHEKELVKADAYVYERHMEYGSWDVIDIYPDTVEFSCPKCKKTLFKNEEEALKFLKEKEGKAAGKR